MGGDWHLTSLGELLSFSNGRSSPERNEEAKHPVFGSNGIIGNTEKYNAPSGSIIIGRVGSYCGSVYLSPTPCWVTDNAIKAVAKNENSALYLYYLLGHLQLNQWREGSGQPLLNQSILKAIDVVVPIPEEQKAIAHILGTLDDKIELNRQMNDTLEAMAQALFKSWFVDFDPVIDNALAAGNPIPEALQAKAERRKALGDQRNPLPEEIRNQFPNRFVFNEEMGWVPEGWEVKQAHEVATISIGKTPPRKEKHWFSDDPKGNVIWVSIKDMGNSGAFIGDSSEYLTAEAIDRFNIRIAPADSVILSFKLTLGRVAIAQYDLTTNEAIAHFVSPRYGLNKEYIYCYLSNFDFHKLGSTSSIATAVNSKLIKAMPFLVASEQVSEAFNGVSRSWFARIRDLRDQNLVLSQLRDTLLPKLLSGQLRIPDAEKMVANL